MFALFDVMNNFEYYFIYQRSTYPTEENLQCKTYPGIMQKGSNMYVIISSFSNFKSVIYFALLLHPSLLHDVWHLTHWGWVKHICVTKLTINGSDNGLSRGRRPAIIWTNARILLIGPSGTNFSEIVIGIHRFSFKKIHFKMSSAKWRPFGLGLNMLTDGLARSVCSTKG